MKIAKKALSLTLVFILFVTITPSIVPVATAAPKDPVLFVHGWTGDASNWDYMKAKLVKDGWPAEILFSYTFSNPWDCSDGANVRNAEQIKAWVDNILAKTGAQKVDLVSHSMGGLSARYYIKYLGGKDKVDDYVSICSPHHGSVLAIFVGGDMEPNSPFLRDLNAVDETPYSPPVSYTCVWSSIDELVIPGSSAKLAGATNKHVWTFHLASLTNSQVYSIVKTAIA